MNRSLVGAFSALLLGGATLVGAGAAPAAAASPGAAPAKAPAPAKVSAKAPKAVTFAGTVALSNCSGSVVRTPGSADTDPALVLSNGHCLESGFPGAGEVIVDKPSSRSFTLLTASGGSAGTVRASKVAYATMTDTDISLYQLTSTYAQIQSAYGIKALPLSDSHPTQGSAINVVSGYWKKIYSCNIDGFAYRLKEGDWTWKDSVRYTSACNTIGGTSGSPVVDPASGKVVAVNNTGNEDGGRCTLNNPCEVDENGTVTVRQGINYAQETYGITKCVTTGNKIDLNLAGCALPKP
ncbi:serine protease [Streptomyces antimycoticus]|uniref:Serine protease n=1 Tax=Streptomyces mordarskii TaxID=1226758 RepID=A0ABN1DZL5_9ACTN|nr:MULTISPECIES: serine protease [Streptomyces]AJZ86550.2 trypsin-like peptidase domain-containing protein [Streptomyces sp. AgN23]RSS41447.1 serine protease [Streptomyces sp. WAC05858]WJD97536.1 serine protease [Streptomyces antimycoticus]WTA83728.1 serine protease [Streptomyces antimycoticus]WTB05836.1 serine protease [Streptomyces antimycoticus]